VGDTNKFVRAWSNLPYLEHDPERGWYIHKGTYYDPQSRQTTIRNLIEGHSRNPGIVSQIADCLVASVVTPIRYLASAAVSSAAFARQHTATSIDSIGILIGTVLTVGAGGNAYVQSAIAIGVMFLFMRVGLYNMMTFKIQKALIAGRVPDLDTIKIEIAEDLKRKRTRCS